MQNKLILIFTFLSLLSFSAPTNAQELMTTKDGKQYIATAIWDFFCEDYAYSGILKVQIAKIDKGGILKLAINVSNDKLNIGERVYVVLKDGSYIYCADKGIRDYKNNETISYYFFTQMEMNRLKANDIQNIRFKIIGKKTTFNSQAGYFTATNKKVYFDPYYKSKDNFETNAEIKMLYKPRVQ